MSNKKNIVAKKVKKSAVDILSEGIEVIKANHHAHELDHNNSHKVKDLVAVTKPTAIISDVVDSVEDFSDKSLNNIASVSKDMVSRNFNMQKDYFKYLSFNDLMLNNIKLFEANFNATNKLMLEVFNQMINISKNSISIMATHK